MGPCMAKGGGGMTADQANAVACVQKMFGMWGEGKFASSLSEEEFVANMNTVQTEDATWDFTGPGIDFYKTYTGAKAFAFWMKYLEEFDFPNMNPSFFPGPAGTGMAIMYMCYDMAHKTNGGKLTGQVDVFVFHVKGDKIATVKQYWGNPAEITKELGPKYGCTGCVTDDQCDAMKVVQNCFGAWGQGKFKASQPDEEYKTNIGAIWADDHELDVRGPASPYHILYKSNGKIDGTKNWITFLDSHEFTRMEPSFFPGPPGSNKVYINMSYDVKYKTATCMDLVDTMCFTVKDGKVVSLKQFWGDPARVTQAFGDLWEM